MKCHYYTKDKDAGKVLIPGCLGVAQYNDISYCTCAKFLEVLEELQSLDLFDKFGEWKDNIPPDILKRYFLGNHTVVASGIDTVKHRHYETAITVIEICDKYLGIRSISKVYSEMTDPQDLMVRMEFFEMSPITITSYRIAQI